jgi:O-antigen/teichoic acid export membrane protein
VKLLNLDGFGGTIAKVSLWTGVVFVGLLAILVGWLGYNGAAAAAIIYVLLSNAMIHRRAVRHMGLSLVPPLRSP